MANISINVQGSDMPTGCAVLFLLPFFVAGLNLLAQGIRSFGQGGAESLAATGAGILFCGVSAGAFVALRRHKIAEGIRRERFKEFAGEPWRTREDWASGRIVETGSKDQWGMVLFAVLWNAIAWPIALVFTFVEGDGEAPVWLVWLFPAVGVVAGVAAVRAVLHRRKFGKTVFEMDTVPGVIGGALRGIILTGVSQSAPPREGFDLCLSCFRRVVTRERSGNKTSTRTNYQLLWRDEKKVRSIPYGSESRRLAVPVTFQIPFDQPASTLEDPNDRIMWRLDVSAKVPGIDYKKQLEIPVFSLDNAAAVSAGVSHDAYEAFEIRAELHSPVSKGITMSLERGGWTAFDFAPARYLGGAAGLTVLAVALLTAFVLAATMFDAPVWGLLILLLVGGGFAYGAFRAWTLSSRVLIREGRLTVVRGPLRRGTERQFDAQAVQDIYVKLSGTQGSGKGTTFYDVCLRTSDGKDVVLGDAISNKQEADWLAQEMKQKLSKR